MIELFGGEAVVFAPKELSWLNARDFCQTVARAVGLNPETIVIDLAFVEFCDDKGITVLASSVSDGAIPIEIRNMTSAVRTAAEQTGIELSHPRVHPHDRGPRHVGPFWVG